jgi:hypothetical protein
MGQDGNEKWKLDHQGTKTLYFSGLAQKSRGAKKYFISSGTDFALPLANST